MPAADTVSGPNIAEAILDSVSWTHIAAVVAKDAGESFDLQWMSDAFAELLGITNSGESMRGELLRDPLLTIASDARLQSQPVKTLVTSPADTAIPVEVSAAASCSERNCWAAVVSDTRSSHEIEEAVRRSEERFESLVESLVESVWIVRGGQVVYANSAALALLQIARSELEKKPFWP